MNHLRHQDCKNEHPEMEYLNNIQKQNMISQFNYYRRL